MARRKKLSRPIMPHDKYHEVEVILLNRSKHLEGKSGYYNNKPITSRVLDLNQVSH